MIASFQLEDETLSVEATGQYADGTTALQVFMEDGDLWATLTACSPGTRLGDGEVLVKTYSENEPMVAPLLATGAFEDTGRRVPAGFAELQVWRLV